MNTAKHYQDRSILIESVGHSNVFILGEGFYENEFSQYATSSYYDPRTLPALIVKPKNREDIASVLEYAKNYGIGVAIRTGGHQYSGASSATSPNIQLDLSKTFQGLDDRTLLRKRGLLRTSVSWSLKEFSTYLRKHKIFVPHGQCIAVHLGGHVQTGGYGQLGRSFGLLGDHVTEIEIVGYEGTPRTISRKNDPDLFFGILGGSPGNFGVLTHFTIKIYRDEDYQGSTGMKCLHRYSPQKLQEILDVVVKISDEVDPDGKPAELPRNYDVCVSVLSSGNSFAALFPGKDKLLRDIFNKDKTLPDIDPDLPVYPQWIIVWAQWAKLKPTDTFDRSWFDKMSLDCVPEISMNYKEFKPVEMSEMTSKWWVMDTVREYPYPYVKSTRMSDKKNLRDSGWSKWITGRIDEVMAAKNGPHICAQIQPFGGAQSMTRQPAPENSGTAYSWRDSTICCTLDCFYEPGCGGRAREWLEKNEKEAFGPKGFFSTKDMRPLWGSFGEYDFSKVWNAYHEDETRYNRLRELRKKHDPDGVFTANTFCVPRAA